MKTIKHKFRNFNNREDIEILILGTFNPDTRDNPAEFFYGRGKNYLWNLLPQVFDYPALKIADVADKMEFMDKLKIGFADIIQEVIVDGGEETNYADDYIDSKVSKWIDFGNFISSYSKLEHVFFTRKTFTDVPNMKSQIEIIKKICAVNGINFSCLPTPARFENAKKLDEWVSIIKQ